MNNLDATQILTALIAAFSIPSALTGFFFWLIERRIQRREKERDRQAEELRKQEESRDRAREEFELMIVQNTGAALTLAEATAKAVQRIPDAHCNGDMHAALEYAAQTKHAQKEFLMRKGIHALNE